MYVISDGLVLQKPSYFNALSVSVEITSPMFQYSDGSYVHLEYSIDWGVEDTIIVELVDVSTNDALILWEREIYKVSGYLPGIVVWSLLINSLPIDKILDWSKFKAFADDKIYVIKMMIFVFDRVQNIVGKGYNVGYQHFLFFPQCFLKVFFFIQGR